MAKNEEDQINVYLVLTLKRAMMRYYALHRESDDADMDASEIFCRNKKKWQGLSCSGLRKNFCGRDESTQLELRSYARMTFKICNPHSH